MPTSFDYETTNGRHRKVNTKTVLKHLCQETSTGFAEPLYTVNITSALKLKTKKILVMFAQTTYFQRTIAY
jgi:hypothetical protein